MENEAIHVAVSENFSPILTVLGGNIQARRSTFESHTSENQKMNKDLLR